jgi:hypothetical protein
MPEKKNLKQTIEENFFAICVSFSFTVCQLMRLRSGERDEANFDSEIPTDEGRKDARKANCERRRTSIKLN